MDIRRRYAYGRSSRPCTGRVDQRGRDHPLAAAGLAQRYLQFGGNGAVITYRVPGK